VSRALDLEVWTSSFMRDPNARGHYLVVCALRQARGFGVRQTFQKCERCGAPFDSTFTTDVCATCTLLAGIDRARVKADAAARIQDKLRRAEAGEKVSLAEDIRDLAG
jgi:hypothetical protein